MDWLHPLAGLLVGFVVGLTGVGGGSLMAPIMILMLGVAPVTAVGTDLWFAAITKMIGGLVHHQNRGTDGGPDWQVVGRLCLGSLPLALVTLWVLSQTGTQQVKGGLIMQLLGGVLVATAAATLLRGKLHQHAVRVGETPAAQRYRAWQTPLTVLSGAILGVLVTLTSVGAGALGATMLIAIYPVRLNTRRLVATDIVHAVPLTVVAGIGHLTMGTVNLGLLGSLLIGSIPGIVAGSLLASRVPDRVLRPALAAVLAFAGLRLLL